MGARRGHTVAALVLLICAPSFGLERNQPPFESAGGIRCVTHDPARGVTYAFAPERSEIVGLRDGVIARIPVDTEVSAIAVAGDWLGILSRVDAVLTIVHAPSGAIRHTVGLENGASSLFSASDEAFGIVNPFRQSIEIIDAPDARHVGTLALPDAVPVAGAVVGDRYAILLRAPNAILFVDKESLATAGRVALPRPFDAVTLWKGASVAAVSGADMVLVDAQSVRVTGEYRIPASHVSVNESGILGVRGTDATLYRWDTGGLVPLETWRTPDDLSGAQCVSDGILAWAERPGRIWTMDSSQRAHDQWAMVRDSAAVDSTVPAVAPFTPGLTERTPPRTNAFLAATEAPETPPAPEEDSAPQDDAPDAPADAEETDMYSIPPPAVPLGGRSPYAPFLGREDGAFLDDLETALSIGGDSGSLLRVNWNEDMEDIETEGEVRYLDGQLIVDRPVRFRIDDMSVAADNLTYSEVDRELVMQGNVRLERDGSVFTADSLRLSDPLPESDGKVLPLVPAAGSRPAAHPLIPHGTKPEDFAPRTTRGIVQAENVVWEEGDQRELIADSLEFDLRDQSGTATNARGHAGPLYFGTDELIIAGPGNLTADRLWVSTCDLPVPHYRLRLSRGEIRQNQRIIGTNARLQVGRVTTPIYFPRISAVMQGEDYVGATELEIGGRPVLGTVIELAQWFKASNHADLAPRLYATTRAGIGLGVDGRYDLMDAAAATFFRSTGEFQTLYTTEDRGYGQWYHRQELTPDTVALAQTEWWSDADFVKDFYNSEYSNRTGPRTFVNVTHTRPEYIASATVAPSLHSFTRETEKLPELSFHLLERRAVGGLYGTFDTTAGYYGTEPSTLESFRTVSVGRMSYDWNAAPGFNVLPFVEVDGAYYSRTPGAGGDALRGSGALGVTLQGRLQRSFGGMRKFSGFKHLIVPSTTLLYRPAATLDAEDTPRFDDFDDRPARFRIENTIDNIVLGRNANGKEVWPVARVTFYHGNDFYNESVASADYELEIEIRPRPWWGLQTIGEMHSIDDDENDPGDDFSRVLAYLFFDNEIGKNTLNGRIGFAYTEAAGDVINQEILYGGGYKINENWSVAFEQRYDIDRNTLTRQSYAIRRRLHKWEMEFVVRERERGIDVGLGFNLSDFRDIGLGL